ncbi:MULTISPECIES: hypothetical protein [Streptomyces]|uniref:Lipoprotein n=1 Tax=Streptomyces virginiae TaxID=1961 RepID=A0ABQ3NQH5_STRVG|nr:MULTISPECIES: hypothetical protein [Streptomyces]KOU09988.1 hypothetical protein ADK49_33635 [Streptomyces sp. WM6349]KOU93100.1 hypothetical protein ADK92_26160 [Streptomyces sp. XY533]KOV01428.1 hypothetical protein ADK91_23000 [Streptomyces sp. XY511]KOV39510.1 hypothetical protein ADK98_32260 [Streptomyces sp. H036]MBP2347835.1 hypothetical protein [Streptomyces virginiae]
MGAIRTSATALLSAGATFAVLTLGALGAPAAFAAGARSEAQSMPRAEKHAEKYAGRHADQRARQVTSFGFTLTPSTVAPGGQVVLAVSGCNAAYSTASSGVFDTVSIARGQTVRVTVDRDARPGALYSVSFTCNGETGSADLTIAGGTTRPTTSSTRTAATTAPAPVTTGAALGVRGGLGGSVAGMDPVELGAGAGLFLAAAGGTAYALRRRASGRGH